MQIAYDGTAFHGWQIQKNAISVQQTMETALALIAGEEVQLVCAGRTDTGVHAEAQHAHFDFPVNMTGEQIRLAINVRLPHSIRVIKVIPVLSDFHARYDAFERGYRYELAKTLTPFNRNFSGFIRYRKMDKVKMLEAIPYFLGSHDYSSFGKPNPEIPNRICYVKELTVIEQDEYFIFNITADRFLHNMVRRIVGLLINIGTTKMKPEIVKTLLEERDPNQRLILTAPPQGLYLVKVGYPPEKLATYSLIGLD
jgi:tRNA pseudouridine38-40 synthase